MTFTGAHVPSGVQPFVWHSPRSGQSSASLHATHMPAALHTVPPPLAQGSFRSRFDVPHTPATLQVGITQSSTATSGQRLERTHSAQVPLLQMTPPVVQEDPVSGGVTTVPFMQMSPVHSTASGVGVSPSFGTGSSIPIPSHWKVKQSSGSCCGNGVPAIRGSVPQIPPGAHTAGAQKLPGHCSAFEHPMQTPLPSQYRVPSPQGVSSALGSLVGRPSTHASSKHARSAGRSVSSMILVFTPPTQR